MEAGILLSDTLPATDLPWFARSCSSGPPVDLDHAAFSETISYKIKVKYAHEQPQHYHTTNVKLDRSSMKYAGLSEVFNPKLMKKG